VVGAGGVVLRALSEAAAVGFAAAEPLSRDTMVEFLDCVSTTTFASFGFAEMLAV